MKNAVFYKNKTFIRWVIAIAVLTVFVLIGKAITRFGVANDCIITILVAGGIIAMIVACTRWDKGMGCLTVIGLFCLIFYIGCLYSCESNYKIVKTDNGMEYIFKTPPYGPVTIMKGEKMDTLHIIGWIKHHYAEAMRPEKVEILRTVDSDGRVTLSSMYYNSINLSVYVDRADSVVVERRKYKKQNYDIFRVWEGDSIYTVDVRGYNPDKEGYSPVEEIEDPEWVDYGWGL